MGLDTIAQVEPMKTAYRYVHFKQACRPAIEDDHVLAFVLQVFEALISDVAGYKVFRLSETLLANTVDETHDDDPFIVLAETKFSFRCIPVWIGTLLTGLGSKKKNTCDNVLTMTSQVPW